MKVYTKTGDKGKTSLIGGTRVDKFDPRLEAYGTVDELNSYIGMIRCYVETQSEEATTLIEIQKKLFVIGGVLATDMDRVDEEKRLVCQDSDIKMLEEQIDRMEDTLPKLQYFILPGGEQGSSFCHLARTVCRRAERLVLKLAQEVEIQKNVLVFLNRLSDYCFVLARVIAHQKNAEETPWIP